MPAPSSGLPARVGNSTCRRSEDGSPDFGGEGTEMRNCKTEILVTK